MVEIRTKTVATVSAFAMTLSAGARVTTEAPGWTFTDGETPDFRVVDVSNETSWVLSDWRGNEICRGNCSSKGGRLSFGMLPAGYYRVRSIVAESEQAEAFSFCVVSKNRCRNEDAFFGTDSALSGCSWYGAYDCPWYGGDNPRVTAELMGKCGFVHTRERWVWGSWISPEKDKRDFSRPLHSAEWMQKHGVKSLGLLGDAPGWLKKPGKDLPDDLMALYGFAKDIARIFAPYYDAWEYCNEAELSVPREPVWEYVAALKAFALGARAGSPSTIILPSSFASIEHGGYAQTMFEGDVAKYVQAFNIHSYLPLRRYAAWHANVRTFMGEAGISGWQIWLTESGTAMEGNGFVDSSRRGLKAHSPEQEMLVAEFYPKSCILHQQGGIYRNWYFMFGCYNEQGGRRDWGTMRRDGTVKPVHAAMAAIASELGDAKLLGEKKISDGVRAFVYEKPDGKRTLAFWSESEMDTDDGVVKMTDPKIRGFVIDEEPGVYRLVDMMGTPSVMTNLSGRLVLEAERFPRYLTGLHRIVADVRAADCGRLAKYNPKEDEDLTVVIRPETNPEDFSVIGGKRIAELLKERGRINLEIWNLSSKEKRGAVGCRGGSFGDTSKDVALPPWGKTDLEVLYTPPAGDEICFDLDIAGKFNGKRSTKVRIPVVYNWRFMRNCQAIALPRLNDPKAWHRNDSAKSYHCGWDEKEKGVLFEVEWDAANFPVLYPYAEMSGRESFEGVRYIEFEAKSWQDKVENDMGHVKVLLIPEKGATKECGFQALGFEWEKRTVVVPEGIGAIKQLRIGFAPRGRHLKFWLRNVRLLKAKE